MDVESLVESLVDSVGRERFDEACRWAWQTAAGTGGRDPVSWPYDLAQVPHELGDLWDRDDVPVAALLAAAHQVYRLMPCYANLMYAGLGSPSFGPVERAARCDELVALLEEADERLAAPVAYALWVDEFESPDTVDLAWTRCATTPAAGDDAGARRLDRVLRVSGPVPWRLKWPRYEALAADPRWHEAIAVGLVGSAFDVFGQLEVAGAVDLLARSAVDDSVPGVVALRRALADRA